MPLQFPRFVLLDTKQNPRRLACWAGSQVADEALIAAYIANGYESDGRYKVAHMTAPDVWVEVDPAQYGY
jgi:hypothetical protein